jgi:hypothetical protein
MLPVCHPAQIHYTSIVSPSLADNLTLLLAYGLRDGTIQASLDAEDLAILLLEKELYEIRHSNSERLLLLSTKANAEKQLLPLTPSLTSSVLEPTVASQLIQNDVNHHNGDKNIDNDSQEVKNYSYNCHKDNRHIPTMLPPPSTTCVNSQGINTHTTQAVNALVASGCMQQATHTTHSTYASTHSYYTGTHTMSGRTHLYGENNMQNNTYASNLHHFHPWPTRLGSPGGRIYTQDSAGKARNWGN